MLQIIRQMHRLDFSQLMAVYQESNCKSRDEQYPNMDIRLGLLEAEQDHYSFLCEFLLIPEAFVAVWVEEGIYKAALRIEPYKDGFLWEGLETAPESRKQGYAKQLVRSTLEFLTQRGKLPVYSHVEKRNLRSISIHTSCGFVNIHDYAVFVDGSVNHDFLTLRYTAKKQVAAL